MKLDDYLTEKGLTDDAFAALIGVSRSMVTKLRKFATRPSAESALAIQIASGGAVMLADLMPPASMPLPAPAAPKLSEPAVQA